jgi:hypothetical protein
MGSTTNLREKCLLVKEKWAIVLTVVAGVCYRLDSDAAVLQRWFRPLLRGSVPFDGRGGVAVVLERN